MVNICDFELLGKELKEGEISVNLTREFFLERVIDECEAKELLNVSSMANLVGTKIIRLALDMKLAKLVTVKNVSGVPFLMIYKFQYVTKG